MEASNKSLTLHTGAKMPIIGYGSSEVQEKDIMVEAVLEAGYRHIDTAQKYMNENVGKEYLFDYP